MSSSYPVHADYLDYLAYPTIAKRNKLVERNLGLVRKVAHQVAAYSFLPYEDLEQVGFLTLIACLEKFDPRKGFSFSTFAIPILRGRILNYLRDKGHTIKIPRQHYDLIQKAKVFNRKFLELNGRAPTDAEIAVGLEISLEKYRQSQMALLRCRYLDSDSQLGDALETMNHNLCETYDLDADLSFCSDRQREALEKLFLEGDSYAKTAKRMKLSGDDLTRLLRQGLGQVSIVSSEKTPSVASPVSVESQFAYKQLLGRGLSPSEAMQMLRR